MAALLEIENLDVRYGHHLAVENLSLSVDSGQVAVLFGPNGAGKTSTLNAVSGAVKPKRGRISFFGEDITGWPMHKIARRGLVQVPEGRRIIGRLTVRENLLLGAYAEPSRAKRMALLKNIEEMIAVSQARTTCASCNRCSKMTLATVSDIMPSISWGRSTEIISGVRGMARVAESTADS